MALLTVSHGHKAPGLYKGTVFYRIGEWRKKRSQLLWWPPLPRCSLQWIRSIIIHGALRLNNKEHTIRVRQLPVYLEQVMIILANGLFWCSEITVAASVVNTLSCSFYNLELYTRVHTAPPNCTEPQNFQRKFLSSHIQIWGGFGIRKRHFPFKAWTLLTKMWLELMIVTGLLAAYSI